MSRSLFGTDGVRGRANTHPMTAEMALRLGAAAGRYFRRDGKNGHRVVIGKDTRLSGYMLENALTAGLTSTGMNVLLLGPVPTPAVGFLPRLDAGRGLGAGAVHPQLALAAHLLDGDLVELRKAFPQPAVEALVALVLGHAQGLDAAHAGRPRLRPSASAASESATEAAT